MIWLSLGTVLALAEQEWSHSVCVCIPEWEKPRRGLEPPVQGKVRLVQGTELLGLNCEAAAEAGAFYRPGHWEALGGRAAGTWPGDHWPAGEQDSAGAMSALRAALCTVAREGTVAVQAQVLLSPGTWAQRGRFYPAAGGVWCVLHLPTYGGHPAEGPAGHPHQRGHSVGECSLLVPGPPPESGTTGPAQGQVATLGCLAVR